MLILEIDRSIAIAPQVRLIAVRSFVDAWSQVCTTTNARIAARVTGTYPCKLEPILDFRFVRKLTP